MTRFISVVVQRPAACRNKEHIRVLNVKTNRIIVKQNRLIEIQDLLSVTCMKEMGKLIFNAYHDERLSKYNKFDY